MVRYATILLSALFVGWLSVPSVAEAQIVCGERSTLAEALEKRHSELPVSMGLSSSGAMIEVFASPNGSWTIIMTQPSGLSCLVASGESWEDLPRRTTDAKS